MIGRSIGRYRIVEKLGQGGMGTVWKAEDTLLGRAVALKLLPETLISDPRARHRFLREAQAASSLDHPGVATLFDAGELGGQLFIAIAFIDGETFAAIATSGVVEVAEALRLVAEAADALEHAHARGILHRDVTGRNLMRTREGRVVVLDFGLALISGISRPTTTGAITGTLGYIAPEILLGRPADARSDIYGLGVVLYELLTGTLPFRAERMEALLYAATHSNPEPPSARRPSIPAAVDAVVLRAMAREPADRWSGAAELAEALRDLGAGGSGTPRRSVAHRRATPAPPPDAVAPPSRPRFLAVLPFRNIGLDATTETQDSVLATGIAESLSARLARLPGIQVIPPVAGEWLEPEGDDVRRAARHLGADLVLRGSVQRAGQKLRITYSLIDPGNLAQLAGDQVDGRLADIFAIQDQLALRVGESLHLGETSFGSARSSAALRVDAAPERFLQALGYLQRSDNEASVDGAVALLAGLLENGGESASVQAALGRAYLYKHQITREREWVERAQEACRRALALDPDSADVLLTLGSVQRALGRPGAAARSFKRVLRLRPDHTEALIGLAHSLAAAGRMVQAEETHRLAIALRPNYWGGYNELGRFCFNLGRYDEAIAMWKRVAEITPDNHRGYLNLGGAHFRKGEWQAAIDAFHRAIEIRPEASAYSNLGTLHYFLGRAAEAASMFEKAVSLRPAEPRLWGNLGDAYRLSPGLEEKSTAAYDRAIEQMRDRLEINPGDAEGLGWLAEWLARRGDRHRAVQAVRRSVDLAPDDVNCMARAVNVYSLAGDRAEALRWIARALRAGYGLAEFERDPDLATLRVDPAYRALVDEFTAGG